MYELKHVVDFIFKDKHRYKDLSDKDKETFFFIINRKFARKFPKQAQFLNKKSIDKASAMDIWYMFFYKQRTINVPQWWWFKQESHKEKSLLKNEEKDYISKLYNLSENDIYFLEKNFPDELLEEIKKYKKFNKIEK